MKQKFEMKKLKNQFEKELERMLIENPDKKIEMEIEFFKKMCESDNFVASETILFTGIGLEKMINYSKDMNYISAEKTQRYLEVIYQIGERSINETKI